MKQTRIVQIATIVAPLLAVPATSFADDVTDKSKAAVDDGKKAADEAARGVGDTANDAKTSAEQGAKKAKQGAQKAGQSVDSAAGKAKSDVDKAGEAASTDAAKAGQTVKTETSKAGDTAKSTTDSMARDTDEAVSTTETTAAMRDTTRDSFQTPGRYAVSDRWSAEPLFGWGTNDFNAGIGARAGYTFHVPIYVGGTFMWHFGDTESSVGPAVATETKRNFYYPGIEVGYDFGFGPLTVRPYGGTAILLIRERTTVNNVSIVDNEDALMLYPGVTARYNLPDVPIYVGGDTRLLIPLANKGASFQFFAVAGVSM